MPANRFIPLVSSQSGAVPTASGLFPGELALNIADGKLFTRSGSAILLLNDMNLPGGIPTSSAQIVGYISGSTITPHSVQSDEFKLKAGNVSLNISSTDVGDTSDIRFSLVQDNGYMKLRVESAGSGSYPWTVQSIFKLFPSLS